MRKPSAKKKSGNIRTGESAQGLQGGHGTGDIRRAALVRGGNAQDMQRDVLKSVSMGSRRGMAKRDRQTEY